MPEEQIVTKRNRNIIIALVLVLFLIALFLYVHYGLPTKITKVEDIVAYLQSFGYLAPVISFTLLIIQAFVPAVPFFLLAAANGVVYSLGGGVLITWLGALTGASLSFFLARSLGREWVLSKCETAFYKEIDILGGEKGFGLVFLARIVPVIPATLVNLLAGVSSMRYITFLGASALGKLPFIIFYTLMGRNLSIAARYPKTLALIALGAVGLYIYLKFFRKTVK